MSVRFKYLPPSGINRFAIVQILLVQLLFEPTVDTWGRIFRHLRLPTTMLADGSFTDLFRYSQRCARAGEVDGCRSRLLLLCWRPGELGPGARQNGRDHEAPRGSAVRDSWKS